MKSRVRQGIDVVRGVSGGDACIAGTRIAVWTLEQARRLGASDAELLRSYPQLSAEDLAKQSAVAPTRERLYPADWQMVVHRPNCVPDQRDQFQGAVGIISKESRPSAAPRLQRLLLGLRR